MRSRTGVRPSLYARWFHSYLAAFFAGDVSVFNHLTWSWGVQLVFNTTIMFTCQAFLTYRLMIISEGNWWITSVAALMSLVQFVSGMVAACSGLVDHISLETVASSYISDFLRLSKWVYNVPCITGLLYKVLIIILILSVRLMRVRALGASGLSGAYAMRSTAQLINNH